MAIDVDRAKAKSSDAAKNGLIVLQWLVVLLALLLVRAIFFRPLHRAILLRHLESPLWLVLVGYVGRNGGVGRKIGTGMVDHSFPMTSGRRTCWDTSLR